MAAPAEGEAVCGAECGACIDAGQLGCSQSRHRAASVRRALQRSIVDDDGNPVAREVDIQLQSVGAVRKPELEGNQRVLGSQFGAAAMGEHQRMGRLERRSGRTNAGRHGVIIAICRRRPVSKPSDNSRPPSAGGEYRRRSVKDEVRENLADRLRQKAALFPGIIGYDDTVVPQLTNAILSRHHFILLGLRGQAKTRILRALTALLDEWLPVIPGSEINDDPIAPLSAFGRQSVAEEGDTLPIAWLPREVRYIEKLATPDVTIADMIGDIDPIKAARTGLQLGNELAMHFGLLPRANRGIFAINELPGPRRQDSSGPVQHPPGRGRADQRLPGATAARRDGGLLGQP